MSEQLELTVDTANTEGEAVDILLTPAWFGLKQQIFHLAQFGGSVQVICGAEGAGKTTFLNLLSQEADSPNFVPLYLAPKESLNELLVSLLNELGLRVDSEASLGELIAALRGYVQNLEKESLRTVVAIDDADNLDDSSLAALLSVLQGSQNSGFGLHLVLLGQAGLAERIDQLQLLDVSVSDAYLPSFSPSELKTLLHESAQTHKLKSALPVEQVQKVWVLSGGLPGLALSIADQLAGAQTSSKAIWASVGWPYSHLAALAVLIVVLVWAILVRDDSPSPSQYADGEPAPVELQQNHEQEPGEREPAKLVRLDEGRPVSTPEPVQTAIPIAVPANTNSGDPDTIAQRSSDEVDSGSNLEDATKVQSGSDQRSVVTSLYSDEGVLVEQVKVAAVKPELKQPELSSPVTPTPRENQVASSGKVLSTVEQGEKSLLELPGNSYVLQLMATSTLNSLTDFVDGQPNKGNLMIYQGLRKGRRLYILVEGFYTDKPAATAAIANLPAKQQSGGPWPKKVSEIHHEIRQYRAN